LQHFLEVRIKRRIVAHKILYHFVLRCKSKFPTGFELQIKTSIRFLNNSILENLYKIYFLIPRAPKNVTKLFLIPLKHNSIFLVTTSIFEVSILIYYI